MRDRILEAAAQELNARGVKFTIDAVASRLGISKKTIYLNFPSKDALIAGVIDTVLEDIQLQRNHILSQPMSLAQRLTAILTVKSKRFGEMNKSVLGDIQRSYPDEWRKIQSFRQSQLNIILDLLEKGKQTGDIRPVNSQIATLMLVEAINKVFEQDFLAEQNLTFSEALAAITDLFLNGVLFKPNSQYGGAA